MERRKEAHPVLVDRRKRPDFVVHRVVSIFLQKAIIANQFENRESK